MKNAELNLNELKSRISGDVLTADSENYDTARSLWNLSVIQRPAVIVAAETASDILEAVRFAKGNDLKIAVTNTGHGAALPANDSMLIVVSSMNEVEIDADKKTARVAAGAKWEDVLQKSHALGLAPLMGSTSDTGAVGYTLGGGMGWLVRKYGLSVDNVLSYDLVTAEGTMVHASKEENNNLFWALSGGGSAFGVVTAMEVKLVPVDRVYAGSLMYPREVAREVFTHYREWVRDMEEDWTTSISLINFPPVTDLPEFLQGQSFVIVRGCYVGPTEKDAEAIESWLDWKEPLVNEFKSIPFLNADIISNDPKEPSAATGTNIILKDLSDEVIDTLINRAFPKSEPIPLILAEVHHAGGAVSQADKNATAFSQHEAPFILKMIGVTDTPDMTPTFTEIATSIANGVSGHSTDDVFSNFLTGQEKWERTEEAFISESYQKLIEVKNKYDPDNRFSFSSNITPAADQ